jgi:hypothetical protein
MKKLFQTTLILAMLVMSIPVFSQFDEAEKGTPEFRAKKHTEWMKKNLALTPEQEQLVAPINLSCAVKVDSIRTQPLSKLDRLKKLKDTQQGREIAFEKILDASQMQKYREAKKEGKEKLADRRRNNRK